MRNVQRREWTPLLPSGRPGRDRRRRCILSGYPVVLPELFSTQAAVSGQKQYSHADLVSLTQNCSFCSVS